MRWGIILVVAALATAYARPVCALPEGPASGPQNVVYLQRSSRFAVPSVPTPTFFYEGPLLREIQRQAFLVAARDQLGLATRDAWLGDEMPREGENEPFEVVTSNDSPFSLEIRRRIPSRGKDNQPIRPQVAAGDEGHDCRSRPAQLAGSPPMARRGGDALARRVRRSAAKMRISGEGQRRGARQSGRPRRDRRKPR